MVFLFHLAFAMELIALAVGIGLLTWAYRNKGQCIGVARVFGYIITVLAVLVLLCTACCGICYWVKGYFRSPVAPLLMLKREMQQQPMPIMHRLQQMRREQ